MGKFFNKLIEKESVLLMFGGIIFILVSLVKIEFSEEEKNISVIQTMNFTNILLLVIGFVLIILGFILPLIEPSTLHLRKKNYQFRKIETDKYQIKLDNNHILNVIYGTISNFQEYNRDTLVILPANDKFDDKCVEDKRSVLGAFANTLYPNNNDEFKNKIKIEVEKRGKELFNIGDWIYLYGLDDTKQFNAGIIAVTHLNEDESIIASPENVMLAFNGIFKMLEQRRPQKTFIPLIGSGHGGLSPQSSLLYLLVLIIQNMKKVSGNKMKEVNIIIFKNENHVDIEMREMKKIVNFVLNLL
jgi:hypothetical protein